ncbi:MAG: hypothetical protein WC444_00495 [Candidatus Paceibacterota bacterium]
MTHTIEELRLAFANLGPGDLVRSVYGEVLVLRRTSFGHGVLFGEICRCEKHVKAFPKALYWEPESRGPETLDGHIFPEWHPGMTDVEILKGEKTDLAEKYKLLCCDDDYILIKQGPSSTNDKKVISEIVDSMFLSQMSDGASFLHWLKLLGVEISPEKASLLIAAADKLEKLYPDVGDPFKDACFMFDDEE